MKEKQIEIELLKDLLDDMQGVYPEYHYEIVENRLKELEL